MGTQAIKTASLALLGLVLTAALAAPAGAASQIRITKIKCDGGLNIATCKVTTNVPTKAMLAIGADRVNTLSLSDNRFRPNHSFTFKSVAPGTTYLPTFTLTDKKGKVRPVRFKPFKTQPAGTPATLTTADNKLLLNGAPFFMIMTKGYPCIDSAFLAANIAMGVNTIFNAGGCNGDGSNWASELQKVLNNQLWLTQRDRFLAERITGLPEQLQWPAGGLLTTWLPDVGSCNNATDDKRINSDYTQLKTTSAQKPVIFRGAVFAPWDPDGQQNCYDRASMEAMLMLAVMAGVKGFELETWLPWDSNAGFKAKPELATAVTNTTKRLATLGPAILTGKNAWPKSNTDSPVKFETWLYGGITYVAAVNTLRTATTASLSLTGSSATARTASVMWEARSLKINKGLLTDKFKPLAVHIYKVVPPVIKK